MRNRHAAGNSRGDTPSSKGLLRMMQDPDVICAIPLPKEMLRNADPDVTPGVVLEVIRVTNTPDAPMGYSLSEKEMGKVREILERVLDRDIRDGAQRSMEGMHFEAGSAYGHAADLAMRLEHSKSKVDSLRLLAESEYTAAVLGKF